MKNKKVITIFGTLIAVAILVAIAIFIYVVFIVPEYAKVRAVYRNDEIVFETEPENLFGEKLNPLTDVLLTFYNDSAKTCLVKVTNQDNGEIMFEDNIDSYIFSGSVFLKNGKVKIEFCGDSKILVIDERVIMTE